MKSTSKPLVRLGLASLFLACSSSAFAQIAPPPSSACVVGRLVPVLSGLDNGFNPTAGTAVPITVKLSDNCNNAISNGTVSLVFSNGAPDIRLTGGTGGNYTGSWTPNGSAVNFLNLTVKATAPIGVPTPFGTITQTIEGSQVLTGSVGGDTSTPLLFTGGTLSAVSFDKAGYAAPGAIVAIYGRGLADALAVATSLPLPTVLGGTSVLLDGQPIPLNYVSTGQINATIPFTANSYGTQTLTVTRNGKTSNAIAIPLLPADPAIISKDSSGTGQGTVINATTGAYADSSNPVTAGDVLVIYATGLGLTNPPVAPGVATPSDQFYPTAGAVSVLIGYVPAQVIFAGLTPGFASLYQVNVIVPSGITPGNSVPVTIGQDIGSIAQRMSMPVTIAVK